MRRVHLVALTVVLLAALPIARAQRGGRDPATVSPASSFFCYESDGRRAGAGTPAKPTLFSGSPMVRVVIKTNGEAVTPAAERIFAEHAVEALGLWHFACELCGRTSIALILVNDRLFINDEVESAVVGSDLAPMPKSARGMDSLKYFEGREFMFGWKGARGGGIRYQEVQPDAPALERLRASDPTAIAPSVARLRQAVVAPETTPIITVSLVRRNTSCGSDRNIVACALTDRAIELNAGDFAFMDRSGASMLFGAGGRQVNLLQVLLHESGHWLGLPHDNASNNIMANALDRATCLNNANMKTLNAAKEHTWPSRLVGAGALYYATPSGRGRP